MHGGFYCMQMFGLMKSSVLHILICFVFLFTRLFITFERISYLFANL